MGAVVELQVAYDPRVEGIMEALVPALNDQRSHVVLRLPWECRGKTARLNKTSGPRGQIMVVQQGYSLAMFEVDEVVKWLASQGLLTVPEDG